SLRFGGLALRTPPRAKPFPSERRSQGARPAQHAPGALHDLLGAPRARMLQMLDEPLPTVELARRLEVTPSAVSQHLKVLHATGLVTRARDRRQVLYRRSPIGDQLLTGA
ncbi:MAG: helix-turn-helix domain-containing protein, partial [Solirubrobacteraceae bacterium]